EMPIAWTHWRESGAHCTDPARESARSPLRRVGGHGGNPVREDMIRKRAAARPPPTAPGTQSRHEQTYPPACRQRGDLVGNAPARHTWRGLDALPDSGRQHVDLLLRLA